MTTMTDEEATVLGSRAVNAGLRIVPGMKTLHARGKWSGGIVTGFDYDGKPVISTGLNEPFSPPSLTADLRDPGTKGHAVAQLREKYNDPGAYVAFEFVDGNEWAHEGWVFVRSNMTNDDIQEHPTEEEAIVAAFARARAANIAKLASRAERGVIQGSGGDR